MSKARGWLLCLMTAMIVDAGCTEILRNSSILRPMSKHYGGVHTPRTQQPYQLQPQSQEDFNWPRSQGTSHGYSSYRRESALGTSESVLEYPSHSSASQDYWRPNYATSNYTGANYYGYPGTHTASKIADGHSYRDHELGSRSVYQYQHVLPSVGNHLTLRKTPTYLIKGNLQLQGFDSYGKSKHKKTNLYQTSNGQKKSSYPRIQNPYPKHKHPALKTVHLLRGNYYQSPYQRYSISPADVRRYKLRPPGEGHFKASTAFPLPASVAQRHHTTERMDDAYPEDSPSTEDYAAYNDTHRGSNGSYYETYEEVEKTTSEPQESFYEENTSRGYYGDRIYMSTQVPPLTSPDRASLKNRYFIVRRTSDTDDIETIFE